ncbi:hypothetical protein E2C01_079991 [Portunus trituberculatus]|uniref:Uncharacterized protein n=1 Tax=Portunus trituberculatus TaxID=210409 RepID=A0A5B7IUT1_PORTR|nr:hypothetical protein [Portunus trituberculatus]
MQCKSVSENVSKPYHQQLCSFPCPHIPKAESRRINHSWQVSEPRKTIMPPSQTPTTSKNN